MATTYELVDRTGEVYDLITRLMKRWYTDLRESKITICALWADNDEQAALKINGYQCAAIIKKTKPLDRKKGMEDVDLFLDREIWDELSPEQRAALIDHELQHLQIKLTDGVTVLDWAGRPQIIMKPHDFEVGGFFNVMARHGRDAMEVVALKRFQQIEPQFMFEWAMKKKKAA